MAVSKSTVVGGVRRAVWDDDTSTYTEYAQNGTTVTLTRPYTQVETEERAERLARSQQLTNLASTQQAIAAGIAALQADITTLQAGAALSDAQSAAQIGPNFKALCNIVARLENSTIGLARIVSGTLT